MPPAFTGAGTGAGGTHRIRAGGRLDVLVQSSVAIVLKATANLLYDDGTTDVLVMPERTTASTWTTEGPDQGFQSQNRAKKDGWLFDGVVTYVGATGVKGQTWVHFSIGPLAGGLLGTGYIYGLHSVAQGQYDQTEFAGTWVFQGTVIEDATAGTHVSSLTVTPGAGNEIQLLYGDFIAGAGAANILSILILDPTNTITRLVSGLSLASGVIVSFPFTGVQTSANVMNVVSPIIISGAMSFKMSVSTATVSLTHTFAVVCRINGAVPTATLADSVGVPTLTTNTNAVF